MLFFLACGDNICPLRQRQVEARFRRMVPINCIPRLYSWSAVVYAPTLWTTAISSASIFLALEAGAGSGRSNVHRHEKRTTKSKVSGVHAKYYRTPRSPFRQQVGS